MKREADEYILQTLTNMEIEMEGVLGQVRNGIRALQHQYGFVDAPEAAPMNNDGPLPGGD